MHPSYPQAQKQWHEYLTLDVFAKVLYRSIFHPFIACLIPLSICAVNSRPSSPAVINTCIWAIIVIIYHVLATVNHRIAYGKPRKFDLEEEVVVITGGASGLGLLIAEIYGMRGVSVAVLDVKEMTRESEASQNVRWYKCDVGGRDEVERAAKQIENDVCPSSTIKVSNQFHSQLANPSLLPHSSAPQPS